MRTEPCWRCIDAIIDMRICDHFFLSFESEALDAARYLRASKLAEVGVPMTMHGADEEGVRAWWRWLRPP